MRTYKTPIGILPSVTAILAATESKEDQDRLRKWQHKQDKIHGLEQSKINGENYKNRGTEIHEAIKYKFLHNVDPAESWIYEGNEQRWRHLKPFLKCITIIECEKEIWHNSGYAGTLDAVCELDGELTLLDWKTSDRIKKRQWLDGHFTQAAAYAQGYEFLGKGGKITQLGIIVITPEKLQIFTENNIDKYIDLWNKRLDKFKKLNNNN